MHKPTLIAEISQENRALRSQEFWAMGPWIWSNKALEKFCSRAQWPQQNSRQMTGRQSRQTYRRTRWNYYTPKQLCCAGGLYNYINLPERGTSRRPRVQRIQWCSSDCDTPWPRTITVRPRGPAGLSRPPRPRRYAPPGAAMSADWRISHGRMSPLK